MPFVSEKQKKWMFANKPAMAKKWAAEGRRKHRIKVNNKLRDKNGVLLGEADTDTNKIEINVKAHKKNGKLDKAELASTIKHELDHIKNPNMSEKQIESRNVKSKITPQERSRLLLKLRVGSLQKALGVEKGDFDPGTLINKAKSQKVETSQEVVKLPAQKRTAILGLV